MATSNDSRSAKLRGLGDYGIKISKAERDISDAEKYLIMNTKYPVLKLKKSGQGVLAYTASGASAVATVYHGLGYVPIVFVSGEYFDTDAEAVVAKYADWNRWIYRGLQVADLYHYYADSNYLYIEFYPAEGVTDAFSFNLNYVYHIFYDED